MNIKEIEAKILAGLASPEELEGVGADAVFEIKSDPGHVHRVFSVAKEFGIDKDKRLILGVPHSTESVDRMGDIIKVNGWDLKNFKANPQLLFAHDSHALPIGTAIRPRKAQSKSGMKALLIDEKFHTEDMNPQAELIWRMTSQGALPGRSVGFIGLDTKRPESDEERGKLGLGRFGVIYVKAELLESSVVPIPANQTALQGKSLAIAERVLKDATDLHPKAIKWFRENVPLTEQMADDIGKAIRRSSIVVKKPEVPEPTADNEITDTNGLSVEDVTEAVKALTEPTEEAAEALEAEVNALDDEVNRLARKADLGRKTMEGTAADLKALQDSLTAMAAKLAESMATNETITQRTERAIERMTDVLDRVEDALDVPASDTGATRADDTENFMRDVARLAAERVSKTTSSTEESHG